MTQSIIIQVGQCGNQIGYRFWTLALKEHLINIKERNIDIRAFDTFFQCSDDKNGKNLKARAVLIDMEEGVVAGLIKSRIGFIFDQHQLIIDNPGSGNNWAVGYYEYGKKHEEQIADVILRAVRCCDTLQSFFIIHSMGGGTGSGLGSYVLKYLKENYPKIYRFVIPIFPSDDDDVITAPYNCLLALKGLSVNADCVIPVENQALGAMARKLDETNARIKSTSSVTASSIRTNEEAFDNINDIVAKMMLNLTCSSRFNGLMNIDLNEISTNLIPYPDLKFLIASQAPLYTLSTKPRNDPSKKLSTLFLEAISEQHQMVKCKLKAGVFLSCGVIIRGDVLVSDVRNSIDKIKKSLKFVPWNEEGWKTGICSYKGLSSDCQVLLLSNNTSIRNNFKKTAHKFVKLYSRKAHLHHYKVEGMDQEEFDCSYRCITELINSYNNLENITFNQVNQKKSRIKVV